MATDDGAAPGPEEIRRGGQVVLAVLALAAVVVVALVAWRRPDDRTPVAIVGDSITDQGRAVLRRDLGHDWRLRVDGRPGFTVAEQIPAARALAEGDPSQVIVNLGTNDLLQGHPTDAAADDLRTLVGAFPRAACIHVVTINETMAVNGESYADAAAELNATIASMAAGDPRVDVVDWAATVRDHDAGPRSGEPILSDTVHPTEYGKTVLAGLYADALTRCAQGQGGGPR